MAIFAKENKLSPLLKYPGGKNKELKYILPNVPSNAINYFEPFVGGGAVYFALNSEHYYINDKSSELINLYKMVSEQNDEFLRKINDLEQSWTNISDIIEKHTQELIRIYYDYKEQNINKEQLAEVISEFFCTNKEEFNRLLKRSFNIAIDNFVLELNKSFKNKIARMVKLETDKGDLQYEDVVLNLEGAFKNALYMHFRYIYNNIEELNIEIPFATAIYFFIREYCYSSMFRYNSSGKFNVPYGGISYNKKTLTKKVEYFSDDKLIEQLNKTTIVNKDFEEFFSMYQPTNKDFIFLDPPYDTEFSTYAQNKFNQNDQERLANYLINKCEASFMLIIKNTDYILSLYPDGQLTANGDRLYINKFAKKYVVSFQDRNDKNAEHLLITNYSIK
ncbi:DNA adenine methylase [Clostridium sp. DL1XJH146]